jgi:flagellar biosynthesis GTPase FlhF
METQLPATLAVPSITAEQLTPASKKRNYNGELISQANSLTPPLDQQDQSNETFSRAVSPSISAPGSPLTDLGLTPSTSPQEDDMAPESKKRKLTFAEKEVEKAVKKSEKEEKEKQKAEAKAKKDEEKKRKDEEREAARKARDAVKAEKQKAKEAAQHEKDAEKKRKEAESLKKERVRLGSLEFWYLADVSRHNFVLVHSLAVLLWLRHPQQLPTMYPSEPLVGDLQLPRLIWLHL